MAAGGGSKAIIAAFLANLGIAISKSVGFVFTGSSSMLAEAIHSVADTGNQGLLHLGGRLAKAINEAGRRVRAVMPTARPVYIERGFHYYVPGDTAPETAT